MSLQINPLRQLSASKTPLITFRVDDGLDTAYIEFAPRMKAAGMRGTICIIKNRVGNPGRMTEQQIKELSDEGHEIASHGSTHVYFDSGITNEQIITELKDSKVYVESITGKPCRTFAVPGGRYDDNSDILAHGSYEFITTSRDYAQQSIPYGQKRNFGATFMDGRDFDYMKNLIDINIANKGWIIIGLHKLVDKEPGDLESLETSIPVFESMIDYINSFRPSDLLVVTVEEGAQIIRGGFAL